jgi:GH35 family endo-1,4-beta-xylanase
MLTKGTPLISTMDADTPNWLLKEESSITPKKARQLLSEYVHTVVARYRGKLLWWDVDSAAIDDNNNTNPFNLRSNLWLRKLGPDYLKYAFMFASEADSSAKLYYIDRNIKYTGLKVTRTLTLLDWLRSQGVIIHDVGLKWHVDVLTKVTPGDGHYQSAQKFIDNKFDLMVTELDVGVPCTGGYPINLRDLKTKAEIYGAVVDYVLHFSVHFTTMLTWGFTDRYSQLHPDTNFTKGAPLVLDYLYNRKPAYWDMIYTMARVVNDGIYRLSPQSQPNKSLGVSQSSTSSEVELYSGACNNAYEQWNITWIGDGTYRFSSHSDNNRVLGAQDATASIGRVQTYSWSGDFNQEWNFVPEKDNTFRVVVLLASEIIDADDKRRLNCLF